MKVTKKKPNKLLDRLLIDISAVGRQMHHSGDDGECYYVEFQDKQVKVNTAEHAYENFVQAWIEAMEHTGTTPMTTVLVKDGMYSRDVRQQIYPQYKAQRKPRPKELNEEFNKAVGMICETVLSLGGVVVEQRGMEADDVLAYLVKRLHGKKTIWSIDRDLLALVDDNIDLYIGNGIINPTINECPVPEWVPIYKALVGDSSDNLPGAKGFGKSAFLKLVQTFGDEGMQQMRVLLEEGRLHELDEDVTYLPALQKIIDNAETVYACWKCIKFMDSKVNTLYRPLSIKAGYVHQFNPVMHHRDLEKFYGYSLLVTKSEYGNQLDDIREELEKSPFVTLDIETSTPEESDAWCKAIEMSGSKGRKKSVVDIFGSELTGLSLTFGDNLQYTAYLPVDHADTDNCDVDQVRLLVKAIPGDVRTIVHNSSFELPVLYNTWGDKELNNGWRGYLPNVWDTAIMKQYVDENTPSNLKDCSKNLFKYNQVTYEEVTGGKKMRELSAEHVFGYACDDTIMTAALANYCQFIMEIEDTLNLWESVEFYTQYIVADAFVRGIPVDNGVIDKMEAEDDETYAELQEVLTEYLISKGWEGSECRAPDGTILAKLKYWFKIIYGTEFTTRFRKPDKVADACAEAGAEPWFCECVRSGDLDTIQRHAEKVFKPDPKFSTTSTKDMCKLLYEVMGLKVRLRNPPTEKMLADGKTEGNPKADKFAVLHALKFDCEEGTEEHFILETIQKMVTIDTRRSLFYSSYRLFVHWKDGRVHPNLGQTRTVTGRFAPSGPNLNQLPKKGDGVQFRQWILPEIGHYLMSPDYSGQELRLQADYSRDENFLSCYIGDNKRDPHTITGAQIAKLNGFFLSEYENFSGGLESDDENTKEQCKVFRASGKQTNFATSYGALPPKLAVNLVITLEEAELFVKAKEEAFPGLGEWKQRVIKEELMTLGYTTTKLGKRRHLRNKVLSEDKWIRREAERQGINTKIQGSGAEQTKLTMSRFWFEEELWDAGCRIYIPIHDELLFSVPKPMLHDARQRVQPLMEAP